MTISEMQSKHAAWALRNFPNQNSTQILLGVVEEVGELAHAQLKEIQGIRGGMDLGTAAAKKMDAVCDVMIYLLHYCELEKIDLQSSMEFTLANVHDRDWIKYPKTGFPETAQLI